MSNKKGSSYLVLKNDINYSISDDDKPGEQQMGASYGDLEVLIEIEYEESNDEDTEKQSDDDNPDEDIKSHDHN